MSISDEQAFLHSLLVTDRHCLAFLIQTILGQRDLGSLEQGVQELASHIKNNTGRVPSQVRQWLRSPGSIQDRYRVALIQLAGHYRDDSIGDELLGILRQLTFVSCHPAAVQALARSQGIRASRTLTDLLWSSPPHQWHVRETAILRELGRLGWTSTIDHLIRALAVPYDPPARAAAASLASFAPDDVLPQLLRLLDGGTNRRQMAGAADALGRLGDKRATAPLQRASRDADPQVATAAAVALARLGDPNAEVRLVELAYADRGHAGAEMRARALGALGMLGASPEHALTEAAINTLYTGLKDSQPEVRAAAAEALGYAGRPISSRMIAQALQPEVSPLVRTAMIRALGRLGHGMSVNVLLEHLRNEEVSVKIEVLDALASFRDPTLAQHISPWRRASDPRLAEAANRALRRLLYRPFEWPEALALDAPMTILLFSLEDARKRLLPPPPPPPPPGFFGRLFGEKPPPAPAPPSPVGQLTLSAEGVTLELQRQPLQGRWEQGVVHWTKRFSLQVTREPIESRAEGDNEDIGVHFVLRQRAGDVGAEFETVAVSLWRAPSEAVGRLQAKSQRFPCLDPHNADPFLSALRWYMEVHGEPMSFI